MDKEKHITQIMRMLISFRICIDGIKISKENENFKYRYNQNKKLMEEMERLNDENN